MVLVACAAFAGTFSNWKSPANGTILPKGGRTGGEAIELVGGKDGRWTSPALELASDRRYAFVFSAKGPATGSMTSGPACANVDIGAPGADWTSYTNIFRASSRATPTYRETLHLGEWKMGGKVVFDNVELIPVTPRWKRFDGGLELGPGESIDGNVYVFSSTYGSVVRNDARPLLVNRAGFNSNRWCLGRGSEVVYRHDVAGRRMLKAQVSVTCGYHAGGSAVVEVSGDGSDWMLLATITNSSSPSAEVPSKLLPASALWVRFRGLSPCNLQIYSYSLEATVDGAPRNLCGAVEYVADATGKVVAAIKAPVYYDEGYGARLAGGQDAATLWTASSGWKIPRRRTLPTNVVDAVTVKTAANEAEAVQLIVTPEIDLRDVRVMAGDLYNAGGKVLPSSAIDVLRVGYVPVRTPTDGVGCRALWPDPLPPQEGTLAVSAGVNQPFWIRVKPPKGTPRGLYKGALTVVGEGTKPMKSTVPFEVEVFGFELPDRMTCETGFGFNSGIVARYHGLKTDAQRREVTAKYLQSLADHHISPYDPTPHARWRVKWTGLPSTKGEKLDPAVVEPVFDWADWDREMQKAVDSYHFTGFRLHLDGLGGGTYESRREPSLLGVSVDDPAYDVLMGKYLRGVESHLREKGWLDMAYVYWFDEPDTKDYAFVMRGFDTLKRHAPGLRRMLTEEAVPDLLGGPNLWVPLTPHLHAEGEAKARAAGDSFWWYVCCGPKAPYVTEFTDHPGTEMRLWLWQTWGEDVKGVLIWATTYWTSPAAYPDSAHPQNPYEDAMCWVSGSGLAPGSKRPWGNGDGRFLYPPLKAAQPAKAPVLDGPVDSYRLEMLRDGIEDYEYFAMLKRALAEKKAALSAVERARYEALLKVPASVYTSLTEFATDPASMEAHRVKLARALEELAARDQARFSESP